MAEHISVAVAQASEQPVLDAAARLGHANSAWPFLPASSQIVERKALKFIETRYDKPMILPAEKSEMASYLALSASCHALDGWRYLAEAAFALLRGARNQALHLAYYAELRAALSILAGSGIGILNQKHFVLTNTGDVVWTKERRTHDAAWECLAKWASIPANARPVVEALQAFGYTGLDWAEACSVSTSPDAIATHWLSNWSIDLKVFNKDKDARNEASYRPDLQIHALNPLSRKELEIVRHVSAASDRSSYGSFDETDIRLTFDLCSKACELRFGDSSKKHMDMMLSDVFRWLVVKENIEKPQALAMIRVIKAAPQSQAGNVLAAASPNDHHPVAIFSRAFLLLRLASALKRRAWTRISSLVAGGVAEWQGKLLKDYGVNAHLWEKGTAPTQLADLDVDRGAADEDIDNWIGRNSKKAFSGFRLWDEQSQSLTKLCRFERIAIINVSQ
jgi:hypothetical protein